MATTKTHPDRPTRKQETDNQLSDTDETHTQCPHCGASYGDERLARVHISRADDSNHQNRNGLMPEEEIEICDHDGTVIETVSRHPDEIDLTSLDIEDVPSDLSTKRRYAILVAAQNPAVESRVDLTEMTCDRLAAADTAADSIADSTVGRALDDFFHPHNTNKPSKTPAELTPLQQAIWISKAVSPDKSNAGISELVGCASSYPGQIIRAHDDLFSRLDHRLDADSPETIITDELDVSDLKTLHQKGYDSELSLDLDSLIDEMESETTSADDSPTDTDEVATEDPPDATESNVQWGSPTETYGVMQASPPTPSVQTSQSEDHPNQQTLSTSDDGPDTTDQSSTASDTPVNSPATDDNEDGGEQQTHVSQEDQLTRTETAGSQSPAPSPAITGGTMADDLQLLESHVSFFRAVINSGQVDDAPALLQAFADEIEQRCQAIRHVHKST